MLEFVFIELIRLHVVNIWVFVEAVYSHGSLYQIRRKMADRHALDRGGLTSLHRVNISVFRNYSRAQTVIFMFPEQRISFIFHQTIILKKKNSPMPSSEESKKEPRAVTYKNAVQKSSNFLLQNVAKDVIFERCGGAWQREYGRGFGSPCGR